MLSDHAPQAPPRPLAGLKVWDRANGLPGALITKLLGELGARIIRPLAVDQEPFARIYPADSVWRDNVERVSGKVENSDIETFDVCLLGGEDLQSLERTGGAAALVERFPRLIALEIQNYPDGSPHAGRPTVDLLIQANSGLTHELASELPTAFGFRPSLYGAALIGACGILAALIDRESTGKGQAVFASLFEGAMLWGSGLWLSAAHPIAATEFQIPKGVRPLIFDVAMAPMSILHSGHREQSRKPMLCYRSMRSRRLPAKA
jgi:itaconate CoA-transferase